MFSEKRINQKVIFESPVFRVEQLGVELDNGDHARRDVVYHNGGVCVAAIQDDQVYMVEQYRIAVQRLTLELPAGKLEAGENPEAAALRELREETGLTPEKMIYLGSCLPSPGYTSEVLHLYLALDLTAGEMALDPGEHLNCFRIPLQDALEWAVNGRIEDAKTIISLFRAREYLRRQVKEA